MMKVERKGRGGREREKDSWLGNRRRTDASTNKESIDERTGRGRDIYYVEERVAGKGEKKTDKID